MNKITGKALSLVLSAALVVSSFSMTLASAAATKTEYLGAKDSDTVDLVTGRSGSASETDTAIPYTVIGETSDHLTVPGMVATDVAMKDGNDLLSWKIQNNQVQLFLKDASVAGKETLAVRYTATNHRYTAPTQDILFSTVVNYKVIVHQNGSFAVTIPTTVSKYGTIAAGKMTQDVDGTVDQYYLKDSNGIQKTQGSLADTVAQPTSVATKQDGSFDLTGATAGTFFVKVSSSNKVDMSAATANSFTAKLTAPTSADFLNQGSVVAYAVPTITTNGKVALDTAHTLTATSTVTNTIDLPASQNALKTWHGSTWAVKSTDTIDEKNGVQDPLNANAKVPVDGAINVTGANIVLGSDTTMDGNCVVGDVFSLTHTFTMNNGYAKSVSVPTFTLNKGSVGTVTVVTVTVNGGTTGSIAATTVNLDATDAKTATKVGAITAKSVNVKSTNAAVVTGPVTMTGNPSGVDTSAAVGDKITLNGDKISVPSIDFDHYSATLVLQGYSGSVAAPINAENGSVSVETFNSTKSNVTLTGNVNVKDVQVTEGTLTIATFLKANTIGGAGTLVIPANKMQVGESITGVSLKLSDKQLTKGMTVFTAPAYKVYDNMFTTVGFTIDYDAVSAVANRTTDVFKIKDVNFAGLTIAPITGNSNKIVQGDKATFKVNSYPYGTQLPANTKIKIDFNGMADNFSYTLGDDNTITVSATKYDKLFSSLNKGQISATLVDKDTENAVYTYETATYDVQMIETPEVSYKSDTTGKVNKVIGQAYTFKITSLDGSVPTLAVANDGATVAAYTKSGNDYFFKVTPAKVGTFGVYVNKDKTAVAALVITSNVKIDTKTVTIAAGKTYQFKVTASAQPRFQVAGIGDVKLYSKTGNDYFYRVTATAGVKGVHGVYVNGVALATINFAG